MSVTNHEFHVEMTCDGCANSVERVLNKLKSKGIEKVDINVKDKKVTVTTSLTKNEVMEAISKTGKKVEYIRSF